MQSIKPLKRQQGFATLAVALILMFLVSLNVFMGAGSSVIEQQTATNSTFNETASNNAEAGVAAMLAQLNKGLNNGVAMSNAPISAQDASGNQRYQSFYNSPNISSLGYSANGVSGTKRGIVQRLVPSVPGTLSRAPAGVNSLGSVNYGGNFSSSSVESGGAVTGKTANAGAITQNSAKFQVAINDASGNALLDASGNPITRLMTPDEQFMFFFGAKFCPAALAANNPALCVATANDTYTAGVLTARGTISSSVENAIPRGASCSINCGALFQAQYLAGVRYFVVTNGLTINNSSGISATTPLGSKADPVYIFIMDNSALKINGSAIIYGLIYVYTATTQYSCTCKAVNTVTAVTTGPSGTTGATYGPTSYVLATVTPANPSQCTNDACTAATNKCTPSNAFTSTTTVGSTSTCTYQTPAVTVVSGASGTSADVVVNIESSSSFTGTGNSVLNGSFLTSGNITSTNGNGFVNAGGGNTAAMIATPYTTNVSGWTDVVK